MSNPLLQAIPDDGEGDFQQMRLWLSRSVALPLKNKAAADEFNLWNLADDFTLYPSVIYGGFVYEYDEGDGTSAHDPDNGCIHDASGRRYKRQAVLKPDHIVADKDLFEPPADPIEGTQYFVAVAAIGDWAGKDGWVAIAGRAGWQFRAVAEGHILYVLDEGAYYHMPPGGTLTQGMGDLALANASIELKHLETKANVIVEAEQDEPPVSPPDRIKYIVGATPDVEGNWAGQSGKVAEYDAAIPGWLFHTWPQGGDVYDKAAGYAKRFNGAAWARAVADSGYKLAEYSLVPDTVMAGTTMAPATKVMHTITITAEAGQIVLFRIKKWICNFKPATAAASNFTIGLRKDSEVLTLLSQNYSIGVSQSGYFTFAIHNSTDYRVVSDTVADDAAHEYKFEVEVTSGGGISDPKIELEVEVVVVTRDVVTEPTGL